MPIRHGGIFAKRASTWPRDHFCRSTIAPHSSRPTTWNEFLPMSMPTKAMDFLRASAMAGSLSWCPAQAWLAGGAGARPDHPIIGYRRFDWLGSQCGLPQAVDCLTSLGEYMRRRELIRFLGGAVAVFPLASRAQQTTIPHIGVLQFAGPEHMGPFAQALRDLGYVEGKTIQF